MNKRDGWCIWSPYGGGYYMIATMARTRTESIAAFERLIFPPWRKYRNKGFECRPVRLVSTALDDAVQREGE